MHSDGRSQAVANRPKADIRDRLAMGHFRNLLMGLWGSLVSFSKVPLRALTRQSSLRRS